MITLGIDKNNDLYLDNNGNITIKYDLEAMGDIFVNKAQTNRGELEYNTEKGIDFFNTVFCDTVYLDVFQNQLVNELLNTAQTQAVKNYQAKIENGTLIYTVDCQTSYGNYTING